jgi:hypothetical protein
MVVGQRRLADVSYVPIALPRAPTPANGPSRVSRHSKRTRAPGQAAAEYARADVFKAKTASGEGAVEGDAWYAGMPSTD